MENRITEGVIWKQLLKFFLPIMLGTLFQQLYSTVDAIIVGQYIGTQALAAVGNTAIFINLLVGFFMGISSGAGVVVSQLFGARENKRVGACVQTAYALSIWGSLIVTALGLIAAPEVLKMINTPADIFDMSLSYTRVYFIGVLPMMIYNMGTGILRAVGDSKRPLYYLIVASIVNIVLDFVFVLVFDWGVEGTAAATDIAQLVSAILVTRSLVKSNGKSYQLHLPKMLHIDKGLFRHVIRIGIPVGLQSVMYSFSNMIIQTHVNGFGTAGVAAWTAFGKIDFIFWMMVNAMGISVTTFAGQNFGAGEYKRVRKGTLVSLGMSTVITIVLSIIFYVFAKPLLMIFSSDAEVLEVGVRMIHFLAPCYICYICIEIFSGVIRGCGSVVIPTMITIIGVCGFRVVWLGVMMKIVPTMEVVMLSYPISWTLSSLCFVLYYRFGKWMPRDGKAA